MPAQRHGKRAPDQAKPDDGDPLAVQKVRVFVHTGLACLYLASTGTAGSPTGMRFVFSQLTTHCQGDRAHLAHHLGKTLGFERLRPIRKSVFRMWMDLDDQTVGPGSDAGAGYRSDVFPVTGTVAGIHTQRKV